MDIMARLLSSLRVQRQHPSCDGDKSRPISKQLAKNIQYVNETLSNSSDLIKRELKIGRSKAPLVLFYLKGLTNETTIQENIVRPLLRYDGTSLQADEIEQTVLEAGDVFLQNDLNKTISEVLRGQVAVLIEGSQHSIIVGARMYLGRDIEEPTAEKTITGPREGFVENMQQNMAMVRKRLPSAMFKSRLIQLGNLTKISVAICYMEDKVTSQLLQEVMGRLHHLLQVDLPEVFDTSYIGQAIEDHPLSPFPQTMSTERPDRTVANLIEGRVCLLVDGTPKALIVPAGLTDQFQSPEDYYQRPLAATVSRWLRFVGAFLGTTASAIYVAVLTFHYEVIPQRLIVNVAESRAMVPFPSLFEALVLEGAVELLREATNRLPTSVGQVIGVVGALVLGQAAVEASLVSPLLVIVVAVSTIASFTIPNNPASTALRLLRFPLILSAGFL